MHRRIAPPLLTASRWKYTPVFMMDGNFKAEHVKSTKPAEDVNLFEGELFMVGTGAYQEHCATAGTVQQVRPHTQPHIAVC